MMSVMKRFVNEESGQGMTEYGLVIAVVAVFLITALVTFRGQIATVFGTAGNSIATYPTQ